MKISVVIPTYNRLNSLKRVLEALDKQVLLEPFEVVVVSDGSTDGTDEYLKTLHPSFHLTAVSQKNQGAACARNLGIQRARGEIILFIDDDVVPTSNLIAEHLRLFQEKGDQIVVLGPMLSPQEFKLSPWVDWEQCMLVKQYQAMCQGEWEPTARQFYTGNASVKREFLLQAGGFDPSFKRAEDVELAYRLAEHGLRFFYNDQAVGYHYAERSFESWIATPYAYGANDVIFHKQKGQTWILPNMAKEYRTRNFLIRLIIYCCLDHGTLSSMTVRLLQHVALIGTRVIGMWISNMAFSGIFNLRYYQGAADQLGGRQKFFALVRNGAY